MKEYAFTEQEELSLCHAVQKRISEIRAFIKVKETQLVVGVANPRYDELWNARDELERLERILDKMGF